MNDLSYFKTIILHYFELAADAIQGERTWKWYRDNSAEIGDACDTIIDAISKLQRQVDLLEAAIRRHGIEDIYPREEPK